ncbi:MAG: DNA polymerase III subunit chi [Verrucomicrobia bacterium]|nr:DNA polymerase III subunit chi [Verrucomicrobiota bacterium]NDE62824.1 DNA polymerase III subunit chi [Chlamydiota bacterium]
MNVTLFPIRQKGDVTKKILTICQKAIEKKIFIQIFCPNPETIQYLSQLLWEFPQNGFLPHASDETHTCEPILLSLERQIKKPFTHLIWLHKDPPSQELKWSHLYDFDDQLTKESLAQSKKRYHFYKQLGCKISLLTR